MGSYHKALWISDGSGTSRRQRASGAYYWYLPDRLSDCNVSLDGDVVSDVARAERALATVAATPLAGTEGIARLLMRSESVASSQIEGLSIGTRRLLRAELQQEEPDNVHYDRRAATVLGNIRAMERASGLACTGGEFTLEMLREIHRSLCEGTSIEQWGGEVRTMQNWVGGGNSNPLSAEYVPPAPEEVPALLDDLVAFINRKDLSPVVQAALVHAQFESIHPFVDGNGRVGRALIHVCLRLRGVVDQVVPPVSLSLATRREDYFDALDKMQHHTSEQERYDATNDWVSFFSGAVSDACTDMRRISQEMNAMRASWIDRLGGVRTGSATELLLSEIQSTPVFSVETLVRQTGRSKQAINSAVSRLLDAGIVKQMSQGKRSRVFETPDVLAEFNMVERRLASPVRDTAVEAPTRVVPARLVP